MRKHVGERKLEQLELMECTAGGDDADEDTAVLMSDACWNALAKLSLGELNEVQAFIRLAFKAGSNKATALREDG